MCKDRDTDISTYRFSPNFFNKSGATRNATVLGPAHSTKVGEKGKEGKVRDCFVPHRSITH